jgi:hypothetical protein
VFDNRNGIESQNPAKTGDFMRIYTFVFLLGALFISSAHADTYHRFWRGVMLPTLNPVAFMDGLNDGLIPATIRTAAGNGLVAYQPVLTQGLKELPDEIALISYENEDIYNALYSTVAGKAYQNLHWQYFSQSLSHSLVPTPYMGTVGIEQSYDFHPEYANWKENHTSVLVFYRNANETDSAYLERAKRHLNRALHGDWVHGIFDRVVLVAQQYWIEYVSATSAVSSKSEDSFSISLTSEASSSAEVSPDNGINLQF